MKVLILGHNGMLGSMVFSYYKHNNIDIETTDFRWDTDDFKDFIENNDCDFLINCIGANPQRISDNKTLRLINYELPLWLGCNYRGKLNCNFKGKVIHPSTNGEFNGKLKAGELYKKNDYRDARVTDYYGFCKAITSCILEYHENVKQIRAAIVGPEINDNKYYLFEWLSNQNKYVDGYINHYWNGITTLEWAKQSLNIIKNWDDYDKVIQLSTKPITKYDLLVLINKTFKLNKKINKIKWTTSDNKCIVSDYKLKSIKSQLKELREYMKKHDKR